MAKPVVEEREGSERIEDALDFVRLDEIAGLADRGSSFWRSIMLAADRGETLTVVIHCRQVEAVTREAFALVRELAPETDGSSP
jgi:hypothetical protein